MSWLIDFIDDDDEVAFHPQNRCIRCGRPTGGQYVLHCHTCRRLS